MGHCSRSATRSASAVTTPCWRSAPTTHKPQSRYRTRHATLKVDSTGVAHQTPTLESCQAGRLHSTIINSLPLNVSGVMARASAYSGESYHAFAFFFDEKSTTEREADDESPSRNTGAVFETTKCPPKVAIDGPV